MAYTLSINSNTASLSAQRNLKTSTEKLSKTYERLSSGLRINSASDDPAGLIVADSLNVAAKLNDVAIRNANDGISTIAIADSALGEISSILSRMSELAEQSSNGVYENSQRSALASEFIALGSEVERIAVTTTYNNRNLLYNTSNFSLQVGRDSTANSQITVQSVLGTLNSFGLASGGSSALIYSITGTTVSYAQSASLLALSAVTTAITNLSAVRGSLGAVESRLSYAITNLQQERDNFAAAESRIRDVDVAAEAAELARLQILQQAGTSILAQANQLPARVLELLR